MILLEIDGRKPKISSDCFVAENATLAGEVALSERCSVWFGATIRAEYESVHLGSRSNLQDNSVIHTDEGFPVVIGENVSIGHGAIIHGTTIDSNCLIGMGSILMNGSKIGKNSILGAGSLVLQGVEIPENTLALGSPAKPIRKVTDEEISRIALNAKHYDEFRAMYLSARKLM